MSEYILPAKPPLLVPPRVIGEQISHKPAPKVVEQTMNRIFLLWLGSLLVPGFAFYRKGSRKTTKAVAVLLTLIWVALIAATVYAYFTFGLQEIGLTILSSSTYLMYSFYAICGVAGFYIVSLLASTIYLTVKSGWAGWKKILLNFFTLILASAVGLVAAWGGYNVLTLKSVLEAVTQANSTVQISFSGNEEPEDIHNDEKPWGDDTRVNVMILGSDAGPDRWGIRPDILMVASINTITGSTQLFNIPRNLENAPFPEGSPAADTYPYGFDDLINAVWTWAEGREDIYDANQPGLQATQEVMSETLGLEINYYMVVNMQGFIDLVDVLGGITVDVPRDLPIGPEVNGPVLAAGENRTLNGNDALWFARSRSDSTDYDRILRQRCVVSALTQQIDGETLALKLPDVLNTLGDNMTTNIQQKDIKDWAELFNLVRGNTIQGYAFVEGVINPADPDFDFIQSKVAELTADPELSLYDKTGSVVSGDLKKEEEPSEPQRQGEVQQENPYC